MLLVRHNRLVAPFHDYMALSAEQMDMLASGNVSPDIQSLPDLLPFDHGAICELKDSPFYVCSESSRSQQTCRALMERLGLDKEMRVDKNLNEIFFIPSLMPCRPGETALESVRENLYPSILAGLPCAESLEVLQKRVDDVVAAYSNRDIVLFTHGFLMRLVQSYVRQEHSLRKSLLLIDSVPAVDYLGFVRVK